MQCYSLSINPTGKALKNGLLWNLKELALKAHQNWVPLCKTIGVVRKDSQVTAENLSHHFWGPAINYFEQPVCIVNTSVQQFILLI